MRTQTIRTLHRKHKAPPGPPPLYYHSPIDPPRTLRNLEDPRTVLQESEVKKIYHLEEFTGGFRDMTLEQLGNFLGEIGLADDDPNRIIDGPGPATNRPPATIFYGPIQDPTSEYFGKKIVAPAVDLWRGEPHR